MPTSSRFAPFTGFALRSQPDARLVALAREGHDRAFEEIVRRYRPALVAFAGAIVPPHRADDVVQEAFVRAHHAITAGDAELNLKPWLYTVVRNRALNDLRDERAHEHLDEDFDGVPQPPQIVAQREELRGLVAGLKNLPDAQREAILRRELEGRSHEEIAVALGATPGAVRGLIFRARTALRGSLGLLVPVPLLRLLMNADAGQAEAAGAGGVAIGVASAGGGGAAVKAGAAIAVAVIAAGSGIALEKRNGHDSPASGHAVVVRTTPGDPLSRAPQAVALAPAPGADAAKAADTGGGSAGAGYGDSGSYAGEGQGTASYGSDDSSDASGGGSDDGASDSSDGERSGSSGSGSDDSVSDGGTSGSDDTSTTDSGSDDTAQTESIESESSAD